MKFLKFKRNKKKRDKSEKVQKPPEPDEIDLDKLEESIKLLNRSKTESDAEHSEDLEETNEAVEDVEGLDLTEEAEEIEVEEDEEVEVDEEGEEEAEVEEGIEEEDHEDGAASEAPRTTQPKKPSLKELARAAGLEIPKQPSPEEFRLRYRAKKPVRDRRIRINISVTPHVDKCLEVLASREFASKSEVIRTAVMYFVKEYYPDLYRALFGFKNAEELTLKREDFEEVEEE